MSEREVLYRIKLVDDEQNSRVLDRIGKSRRALNEKIESIEENRIAKSVESERKVAEVAEKVAQDRISTIDRVAKHESEKRKRAEKETKELSAKMAAAQSQLDQSRMQLLEGFEGLGEGIGRVGRGVAVLGLVGEENLQKFTDGLAKVIAGFELFTGGIRIVTRTIAIMDALKKSTLAAAAAQQVLNASQGAAGGAVGSAGAAAGSAASGGLGDTVTGGAVGGVASGATAGGLGRIASRRASRMAVRSTLASAASAGGMTAGAGIMATIGSAAAALAGVGAAAVVVTEAFSGAAKEQDSWSNWIAESQASLAEWTGLIDLGSSSLKKRIEEENKERITKAANDLRLDAVAQASSLNQAEIASRRRDRMEARDEGLTGKQRSIALVDRFQQLEQERLRVLVRPKGQEADQEQRKKELDDIQRRQIAITREERQIRQQMNEERLSVIRAGIEGTKQELAISKQRAQAAKDRFLTAQEQFGQLDPREQARLIQIKKIAETRGTDNLSVRELQDLRSVGTGRAEQLARREFRKRGAAAGFGVREFGQQERRQFATEQQRQQNLKIELSDKRTVELNIEKANEQLIDKMATLVVDLMQRRDADVERRTSEEIDKRLGEVAQTSNKQFEQAARQRAGVVR